MIDPNVYRRHSGNPTYVCWRDMMARCRNPRDKDFDRYGGRGIEVCYRWYSFRNFVADMGPKPDDRSLDRIDNDRGYSPDNCRWATRHEQAQNRSTNRTITIDGETRCVSDWARRVGISRYTIFSRLRNGCNPVAAVLTPPGESWR